MGRTLAFWFAGASLFASLLWTATSVAAEPTVSEKRHHLGGAVLGQYLFSVGGVRDNESFGVGVALSYAYRVAKAAELGFEVGYVHVRTSDPDLLLPALAVRLSKPVGTDRPMEFGVTLRLGLSYQQLHNIDFPDRWRHALGATASLAPDLRVHIGDGLSLQVSPEVTVGTELDAHPTEYMEAPWSHYFATGLRVGLWSGI